MFKMAILGLCVHPGTHVKLYVPGQGSAVVLHNIGYPDLQTSTPSSNNSGTFNTTAPKQRKRHNSIL